MNTTGGVFITFIFMVLLVTAGDEGHARLLRSTQNMVSPSVRDVDENVPETAPTIGVATPLIHWYAGEIPPFTGWAINVTGVPAHTVSRGLTVTETDTGETVCTVI